jgi:hypothetical protein
MLAASCGRTPSSSNGEKQLDEDLEFYEAIPESPELRRVRVVVYENPFARIPFRQDLFRGPFDELPGPS